MCSLEWEFALPYLSTGTPTTTTHPQAPAKCIPHAISPDLNPTQEGPHPGTRESSKDPPCRAGIRSNHQQLLCRPVDAA